MFSIKIISYVNFETRITTLTVSAYGYLVFIYLKKEDMCLAELKRIEKQRRSPRRILIYRTS